MNLLMRSNTRSAAPLPQPVKEPQLEDGYLTRVANTLGGMIVDDPFLENVNFDRQDAEIDGDGNENGNIANSNGQYNSNVHSDIDVEDASLIIIPSEKVPENWTEAPDMHSLCSLGRNFIFPGEQIQILACLSAYKQETEIITPFKMAAIMNKNGIGKSPGKQNGSLTGETNPVPESTSSGDCNGQEGENFRKGNVNSSIDAPTGEFLLRKENEKRMTEELLRRFENSYYFVRVAGSDERLWSKRKEQHLTENSLEGAMTSRKNTCASVMNERGKVDAKTCGGLARGAVKCCSLPNGDLVVLLQVNVGDHFVRDPFLEILQFEKHKPIKETLEYQDPIYKKHDNCGQLLKWLLPLDNYTPSASPLLTPGYSNWSSSARFAVSGSAGSKISSSGHSRSSSMSSLPPNNSPLYANITPNETVVSGPEDWSPLYPEKFVGSSKSTKDELLSFRGVPLEPERYSVQCGLEGMFRPGRRWRRKIELIQPLQIDSSSVDCNTEDLICILVKNISPVEGPDVVVYIDAITLVVEEASKDGQPLPIPVSCIEPGNNYNLPNLALRRGDEHSFILKPAATFFTQPKLQNNSRPTSHFPSGVAASQWSNLNIEGVDSGHPTNKYAVIVSCRCNYTESKLIFKHPLSWRPHISRDLVISVVSDMHEGTQESNRGPLPFQVLNLQASNKTCEDLTLTVLAPASLTSPSVVPLSAPCSPSSLFHTTMENGLPSFFIGEQTSSSDSNVVRNGDAAGYTHLWLQSSVPLGCIPPQSTAAIKLEVLPLTDGIITLDSLQIDVKEKGIKYVAQQSLKIYSTSSIATGIL